MRTGLDKRIALGIGCGLAALLTLFAGYAGNDPQILMFVGAGCLIVIIVLFYNISVTLRQRVLTEAKLIQSAAEVSDLYDRAPCGYLSVDPERNIIKMNQTMLNWLGYSFDEVVGNFKFEHLLKLEDRAEYLKSYSIVFERYKNDGSIKDREFLFQRKNGSVFQVTLSSIALFSADGKYVGGRSTVVDSTARKQAELEIINLNQNLEKTILARTSQLAESEKIYRSLAANIPGSAITLLDRDERYMLAEGDMLKKMGYDKDTMAGKKLSEIISAENYEYYGPLMKRAFSGEHIKVEKRTLSGFDTIMTVVPLRDERDEIFSVMYVYIDITEIKKVQEELVKLNNTLELKVYERTGQLKELNSELEAFTYSVSHDLRTPLRAVSGYAQMLQEDYAAAMGDEGSRVTDLIIKNAVRMGKLIDDLLEFSRLGRKSLTRTLVDMNELVIDVVSELTTFADRERITIEISELASASCDRSMLRQVWLNLISNALKYTSRKESAVIKISSDVKKEEIRYRITDNGAGFEMAYVDKLFNVFQRLHKSNEFEGTGVGLALVRTIIKKHGGTISAEGQVDRGATFLFTLPGDL